MLYLLKIIYITIFLIGICEAGDSSDVKVTRKVQSSQISKVITSITKLKEDKVSNPSSSRGLTSRFQSFVHSWASMGYLKIQASKLFRKRLEISNVIHHFKLWSELKNISTKETFFKLIKEKSAIWENSTRVLDADFETFYALSKAGQDDRLQQTQSSILRSYRINSGLSTTFFQSYDSLLSRFVNAAKIILDTATECLLGKCSPETLKLVAEMDSKTIGSGFDVQNSTGDKKSDVVLKEIEENVKKLEDFSIKIRHGMNSSLLKEDLKAKKSELDSMHVVSIALGVGLGVGIPLFFAIGLLILFKSGRLSWSSPPESQV